MLLSKLQLHQVMVGSLSKCTLELMCIIEYSTVKQSYGFNLRNKRETQEEKIIFCRDDGSGFSQAFRLVRV